MNLIEAMNTGKPFTVVGYDEVIFCQYKDELVPQYNVLNLKLTTKFINAECVLLKKSFVCHYHVRAESSK